MIHILIQASYLTAMDWGQWFNDRHRSWFILWVVLDRKTSPQTTEPESEGDSNVHKILKSTSIEDIFKLTFAYPHLGTSLKMSNKWLYMNDVLKEFHIHIFFCISQWSFVIILIIHIMYFRLRRLRTCSKAQYTELYSQNSFSAFQGPSFPLIPLRLSSLSLWIGEIHYSRHPIWVCLGGNFRFHFTWCPVKYLYNLYCHPVNYIQFCVCIYIYIFNLWGNQ